MFFNGVQGTLLGSGEAWLPYLIRQECVNKHTHQSPELGAKTLGEGERRGWASQPKEKVDREMAELRGAIGETPGVQLTFHEPGGRGS